MLSGMVPRVSCEGRRYARSSVSSRAVDESMSCGEKMIRLLARVGRHFNERGRKVTGDLGAQRSHTAWQASASPWCQSPGTFTRLFHRLLPSINITNRSDGANIAHGIFIT
jgi:hypothetical protein